MTTYQLNTPYLDPHQYSTTLCPVKLGLTSLPSSQSLHFAYKISLSGPQEEKAAVGLVVDFNLVDVEPRFNSDFHLGDGARTLEVNSLPVDAVQDIGEGTVGCLFGEAFFGLFDEVADAALDPGYLDDGFGLEHRGVVLPFSGIAVCTWDVT